MAQLRSATEIARVLEVPQPQVWMWYARRERNGFPESRGRARRRTVNGRLRDATVWDLLEVKRWRKQYTPARGGRPQI